MKEKISLVQLTNNQQNEVKAGAYPTMVPCWNLPAYPTCKCRVIGTTQKLCAQVSYNYPHCRD